MKKRTNGKSESPESSAPRTFDLDDVDPDDAVRVDGESYRLARLTNLSIVDAAAVRRATRRMDAIEKNDEPTQADAREYRKLCEEVARLALPDAPAEKIAALSRDQVGQVVLVFFARGATASGMARRVRELLPPSGSSSPGSSGSTAGTP